jgi:hypothetical protein
MRALAFAAVILVALGSPAVAEEFLVAGPLSDPTYTLVVSTWTDGQLTSQSEVGLAGKSKSHRLASGHSRISPTDGSYFEWKYAACVFVQLLDSTGKPLEEFDFAGFTPAEKVAYDNASTFQLDAMLLRVFAPGSSEVGIKLWRSDLPLPPMPPLANGSIAAPMGKGDADGDGETDPPGLFLGSLRWRVDSPDLGYIRDIDVTPEKLMELQYGQPGHIGGPPLPVE